MSTATATPRVSIVKRITQDGRVAEVLVEVLASLLPGQKINAKATTPIHCFNPSAHRNGDKHPSAFVAPRNGRVTCKVCGFDEGLLDLAVRAGHGLTTAEAAAWMESRFYGEGKNVPAAAPASSPNASPLPFRRTAERLGWTVAIDGGRPVYRLPIFDADGNVCGIKVRGLRDKDGKHHAYLAAAPDGRREMGLLNASAIKALEAATPTIVLVAGETDLLALEETREREGIEAAIVSHSNGEGSALETLTRYFAEARVLVVYDMDDKGRSGAAARVEELRPVAASVVDVELPFTDEQRAKGAKDLRDWIAADGTMQKLLALASAPEPDAPVNPAPDPLIGLRTGTDLLVAYHSGEIRARPVLLDGLLRERDLLFLFGPAGMGKSQLAIAIAVSLSLGRAAGSFVLPHDYYPLWDVVRDEPTRVLFVNAEDDEADFAGRLAAYLRARGLPETLPDLLVWSPKDDARNLVSTAGRERLEHLVRDERISVVIVDNITNVLAGLEKSDEAEVTSWINGCPRRLRDRHGATSILLGHANKGTADGDARSALDRLFGSMAWGACADGAIMLDWVKGEPGERRLIHAKSRGFAPFETLKVEAAKGDAVFSIIGLDIEGEGPRPGPQPKVTLAALYDALPTDGSWLTRAELADALSVHEATFRRHEPELLRLAAGRVAKEEGEGPRGRCRYRSVGTDERGSRAGSAGGAA